MRTPLSRPEPCRRSCPFRKRHGPKRSPGRTSPRSCWCTARSPRSSSWDPVIAKLGKDGYRVIAAANPLRSVASDAVSVSAVVRSIKGPVVLVGHSYGGPVITEAANGNANVKALVYVAGFAPDTGETSLTLSAQFPGSTLGHRPDHGGPAERRRGPLYPDRQIPRAVRRRRPRRRRPQRKWRRPSAP